MASSHLSTVIGSTLSVHLQRRPIVLMTCGIAGAGKTTLAKEIQIQYPQFHRLSIDEILHQNHGIYGIDYPTSSSLYAQYQDETDSIYLSRCQSLLAQKQDIFFICKRSIRTKTADSAFDISRETFEMYWGGFESPIRGEDEIIVQVT